MRRGALFLVAALHGIAFASVTERAIAQEQPIMGAQAPEASIGAEVDVQQKSDVYRILVIGDGLAGGLGEGLARISEGDSQFEVANRFQEISGLARPEVYDWADKLPKLMADKAFNAVVVMIGNNDRQEMRYENFRYAFGTPDWIRAYEAQC